jgi:hypothetical protein
MIEHTARRVMTLLSSTRRWSSATLAPLFAGAGLSMSNCRTERAIAPPPAVHATSTSSPSTPGSSRRPVAAVAPSSSGLVPTAPASVAAAASATVPTGPDQEPWARALQEANALRFPDDGSGPAVEARACAIVAARQRELDAESRARTGGRWRNEEALDCLSAGAGRVWSHLVSGAWLDGPALRARWSAVIANEKRIVASGPSQPYYAGVFMDDGYFADVGATVLSAGIPSPSPFLHFDFDGDGVDEFLHPVTRLGTDGAAEVSGVLWTFRSGKVSRFPGAPGQVRLVKDVDGDGRPDLLFPGSFRGDWLWEGCAGVDVVASVDDDAAGLLFVAHSLPDGTFSTTDAVAREQLRQRCQDLSDLGSVAHESDLIRAIPCARVRGVSTAKLRVQLDAACNRFEPRCCPHREPRCPKSAGCVNRKLLETWIAVKPPLRW